jgi:hypothetical protein
VQKSKVGDGSRGTGTSESSCRSAPLEQHLCQEGQSLKGMTALKTTASARYHLAYDLVEARCDVVFGV